MGARLRPGVAYTREYLQAELNQTEANRLMNMGYVLQFDAMADTYKLVHFSQASAGFSGTPQGGSQDFALEPLRKRPGTEKRNSLVDKWVDDIKATGTVPGLSDEKMTEILGTKWITGVSVVTGDTVMAIAEYFLQDAENKQKEADSHLVTSQPY